MSQWVYLAGGPRHGETMKVLDDLGPNLRVPGEVEGVCYAGETPATPPFGVTPAHLYQRAFPVRFRNVSAEDVPASKAGTPLEELPALKVDTAVIYEFVA